MTHDPTEVNVTTPAEIEQTDDDWFATTTVGARNASESTDTV